MNFNHNFYSIKYNYIINEAFENKLAINAFEIIPF